MSFFLGLALGALGYYIYIRSDLKWLRISERTLERVCRGELS